jgi:hypothetical protein
LQAKSPAFCIPSLPCCTVLFVWLVTVPMLVVCAVLGASTVFGGWYGGLGPNSVTDSSAPFVRPEPLGSSAAAEEIAAFKLQQSEYNRNVKQWREDTPKVTRNSALVAALFAGAVW